MALRWSPAWRPTRSTCGTTGTVILEDACTLDAAPTVLGGSFRIHLCAQVPCPVVQWHPSKYGSFSPPIRHATVVCVLPVGEGVPDVSL